jgi:hypothetical protein
VRTCSLPELVCLYLEKEALNSRPACETVVEKPSQSPCPGMTEAATPSDASQSATALTVTGEGAMYACA